MTRILFICHGNICRSPMAEFMFKDMAARRGMAENFYIESAATSREEIGNDIHRGTRGILDREGIPYCRRRARQVTRADYDNFDYLIDVYKRQGRESYPALRCVQRIYGAACAGALPLDRSYAGL